MPKIAAPVLWDQYGNFLNGKAVSIDSESLMVGYVPKPSQTDLPNYPGPTQQCLQVKDLQSNTWYLTLTIDQWRALIGVTETTNNIVRTFTWTVGSGSGQKPAGTTLTDPQLYSVVLVNININGTSQNLNNITFNAGNGTITFPSSLTNGQVVEVICYNI